MEILELELFHPKSAFLQHFSVFLQEHLRHSQPHPGVSRLENILHKLGRPATAKSPSHFNLQLLVIFLEYRFDDQVVCSVLGADANVGPL
jgi:hypothetical protein